MTSEALLHWLQRTSIEASLLILAVLGLRLMLGTRLSPAWRIGLWMLVGAKLMLPAFIPAGFGLGAWAKEETSVVSEVIQAASPVGQSSVLALNTVSLPDAPEEHSWSFSLQVLLTWIWLLGAAAVLFGACYRQRRFNRYLRTRRVASDPHLHSLLHALSSRAGVPHTPKVVLMPAGTTPAMVGIRQPKLLLPEDWQTRFNERSLRHILLHELLHIRHRDLLWNWVATAVQALHWFNPLVWFVVSRFQADRELRCDAGALAILAPSERLDYGHTLLRIQETFFAPPAIAGLAPCVRSHPTLRQRILMIATPTTRQPVIQALLVLTLSVLVGYSFTTARAAEKEVPPKVREGSTTKKDPSDPSDQSDQKKPAMREGEAGTPARQGDREAPKPGQSDGQKPKPPMTNRIVAVVNGQVVTSSDVKKAIRASGGTKTEKEALDALIQEQVAKTQKQPNQKPSIKLFDQEASPRDGEAEKKPGMRDGEKPRTGSRDGEGTKKPAAERDAGTPARKGDGEGRKPSAESGQKPRKGSEGSADTPVRSSSELITLKVIDGGDTVLIGDEKVPMNRLRGFLSTFLPDHPGAKVEVTGNDDTPLKALHNTVDAVRDNGNKNVGIKAE
jgi:beta-lactamase regulating signal transducer with metallopeptidase domain